MIEFEMKLSVDVKAAMKVVVLIILLML